MLGFQKFKLHLRMLHISRSLLFPIAAVTWLEYHRIGVKPPKNQSINLNFPSLLSQYDNISAICYSILNYIHKHGGKQSHS